MLLHYIKTSYREMIRYKTQSIVSIVGLAIGIVSFTYGWYWWSYETSYDNFYPQSKQIYMVGGLDLQTGKRTEELPLILAQRLKQEFPEVKETTQIYMRYSSTISYMDETLSDCNEEFVDESHFLFFPRRVICGREENLLQGVDEIVVTESFARKHFNTPEEAVGKVLRNAYRDVLTIVSVVEDAPENSRFQHNIYELDELGRSFIKKMPEEKQWILLNARIFLLLHEKTDVKAFERKIANYMIDKGYNEAIRIQLVAMKDIRHTFGSDISFNMHYIQTFLITGLLLLLSVFFNFINLLFNRTYQRTKEVKTRSAVGADKKALLMQLFIEISIQVLLGVFLAACLLELTSPLFEKILEIPLDRKSSFTTLLWISLYSWVIIVAVCLPFLSRFISKTRFVLSGDRQRFYKANLRKTSLTLQVGICVFFLFSVFVVGRQISFMQVKDLGFNKKDLVYFQMGARNREAITREVASLSIVKHLSTGGSFSMRHDPYLENKITWGGQPENYAPNFQILSVGEEFLDAFGITLKEGRFVKDTDPIGRMYGANAVVNEEAVRTLGFDNPIGKKLNVFNGSVRSDGTFGTEEVEIVGVVKDYHAASLRNPIFPQIIVRSSGKWYGYTYYARVEEGREQEAIKQIKEVFKKHAQQGDSESPVMTMEEIFMELNKAEDTSLNLFTLLAVLCTLISLFGIYSISHSNIGQRRKEIAIRKVMGASTSTIIRMFLKEYLLIACMANIIFIPLAWLFIQQWLQQYPYKASLSAGLFLSVFFITILLIGITILFQTLKAAKANPAEVVKAE
ncbi:ABC transporter permease [Parabacteroides sp. OttesenSCG-928-J18]|nr:ABC transporter permease [Parabacteroides sp. OttesenSCG-928-J18]